MNENTEDKRGLIPKAVYAKEKNVSLSTVNRWIKKGLVAVEKQPHGLAYRVYILPDAAPPEPEGPGTALPDPDSPTTLLEAQLAKAQEENSRLRADFQEYRTSSELQYQALRTSNEELTAKLDAMPALPAPPVQRRTAWWRRFWRR